MSSLALCPSMPVSAFRKPIALSRSAWWCSSTNCPSRIRIYNRYATPNISQDSSSAPIDVVADVKTERIVVLGGTGFVGTAICKAAVSKGIEVVLQLKAGLVAGQGSLLILMHGLIKSHGWQVWQGSTGVPSAYPVSSFQIGDVFYVRWDEVLAGATAVVSTLGGFGNEEQMKRINGEANILAVGAAKDYGVPKFVLISVHDYNLPSFLLSSGYLTGKRKAESEVLSKYPTSGVVLRPAFIYGKRKVDGFEIPLDLIGEPLERLLLAAEGFIKPLNSLPGSDLLAPPVSVDDVAFAAINAVIDDDFFGVFTIEQIREAAAKVRV